MIKKKKLWISLVLAVCFVVLVLAGCSGNEFVLDKIEVATTPKTVYRLGESLDITGGILKATYSNGGEEFIDFSDERVSFSTLDKSKAGNQVIVVRFGSKETGYTVTVTDVAESIEFVTLPVKRLYIQSEAFRASGMNVKINYEGGESSTVEVTDVMLSQPNAVFSVTGYDAEKIGEQTLTLRYRNNGNELKLEFTVTVEKKTVTGFNFTKKPEKINYKLHAELELSDASFRVAYNNNSPQDVTILKDEEGRYVLKDSQNRILEGKVEVFTQIGDRLVEGFENGTIGSKSIVFRYQNQYAYGLRVNVVLKEIENYHYQGVSVLIKGTPLAYLKDYLAGTVVDIVFTDGDTKSYTFPEAIDSGEVKIERYNPDSSDDVQEIQFDFGEDGLIVREFTMVERMITGLDLADSGAYEPIGDRLEFYTGDTLDVSDWRFHLTYDNGTFTEFRGKSLTLRSNLPSGETDFSNMTFTFRTHGTYTVVFDYHGMENYELTVEILEKTLSSLVVETAPDLTEYTVGDSISLNGLTLRADYADAVTGETVRSRYVAVYPDRESALTVLYENGAAGKTTVVLTLSEEDVSLTAEFEVVFKAIVTGIEIESSADCKLDYIKGERFNPSGLTVLIRYDGSEDERVTLKEVNEGGAWSFSPEILTTVGTVSVTVSYMGKQTELNVTVHNDIVSFELHDDNGNVYKEEEIFGEITVGLPVSDKLLRHTLVAVRENGERDELVLPSNDVTVTADNNKSWEIEKTLTVTFTYLGSDSVFYMTRLERKHEYYELSGKPKELQTASAGFDAEGLILTEFFDNGTRNVLLSDTDYEFVVPKIEFPNETDRVQVDVQIRLKQNGETIAFRWGSAGEVRAIPVVFFEKIASKLSWNVKPHDGFKVDQGTSADSVLSLIANANDTVGLDVSLMVTFTDGTSAEVVLKDHLEDFELKDYDASKSEYHTVRLSYKLGLDVKVDMVLRINPKELIDVAFEGYLIGAQGATEKNTVVEGTDINYSYAFLRVMYGFFYDGSEDPTVLDPVILPVQSAWSDFVKQDNCIDGQKVKVTITYVYAYGQRPVDDNTKQVTVEVTMKAKTVSEVALLQSPKISYVEGEAFTFKREGNSEEYGVLRIIYNNGTYGICELNDENRTTDSNVVDPEKFYVVSNEFERFATVEGGYEKVELHNGEVKTFLVVLKCVGKEISYSVTLRDRAYVNYAYNMDGSSEKLYGDSVNLSLNLTFNGEVVESGNRRYSFLSDGGQTFEPSEEGGFLSSGHPFDYLPAGSYKIIATYDGVPYLYNPGEREIGSFNVLKKTLVLTYEPFQPVVYGDKNPDFLQNLRGEGFAAGETLANLVGFGTSQYRPTFLLGGAAVTGEPKNATSDAEPYFVGVEGLFGENYNLVLPGDGENPYGVFRINRLSVYLVPTETEVTYGDAIPQIDFKAYRLGENNEKIELEEVFRAELVGAPGAYYNGVSLDDESISVTQPNAGKFELNAAVMQTENPNFEISVEREKYVTIKRAPLQVSYDAKSVVYGDAIGWNDVVSNLVVTGWKRNDQGNVTFDVSFKVDGGEDYLGGGELLQKMKKASVYRLTAGQMSFANYYVESVTDGTFTVDPKEVTVTPNSAEKIYGTADPVLTYSAEGLLEGDVLEGALSRAAGEDVLSGEGYAITLGTLYNPNYRLTLSSQTRTLRIVKRELVLTIRNDRLSKYYDGYAPSIDEYALTLLDGGAEANEEVYIEGTAPDREKIRLTFSSMSPDKTSATTPLSVYLDNSDPNHDVILAANYKYSIERLPVEIEWLKVSLDGNDLKPFEYGSVYPYINGRKHFFTARVKIDNLYLNPNRLEDISVSFSSAFDQYYDKESGYYGISNADVYAPSITGVVNSNFTLATSAATSTRIVIEANTVYAEIALEARSKIYDRSTATVDTRDINNIRLYEKEKDAFGALLPSGNLTEITEASYKTTVIRALNFTVGNKPNGVSDVATDSPDGSYQITMNVSDPTLGVNFKAEFHNEESRKYFINKRPINITVYGGNTKIYDGDAPYIAASQLSSSDASFVTASNLQDMLRFTATDNIDMGDVGTYEVSVDTSKYQNYEFSFVSEYFFTITKKEIDITLTEGSGYYSGEKQLALNVSDVRARDNNLGRGDVWEDVFPSLRFTYEYKTDIASLKDGNLNGEKGNVGEYTVILDPLGSIHKNYTFRWYGSDSFTVKPAEVSVLPERTSLVYGEAEGEDAVYRTAYRPNFLRGSDGSSDGSVFLSLDAVIRNLKLDRNNKASSDVGYYNVGFVAEWTENCVDGVHSELPNYRVSLSEYDGANRFQITKRPITVKISDYQKVYGSVLSNADLQVEFPNLAVDLKQGDTLEDILSSYGLVSGDNGFYRFTENVSYRYTYLGNSPSASASPTEALANATREANANGGVYGYRTEFTALPNMKNYEFSYAEDGKGIITVLPKTLTFTVENFKWTYRDEWITGDADADETYLNLGKYFTVTGKVAGDNTELKYPVLQMDGGFKSAYEMLMTGDAGSVQNIVSSWFDEEATNSVERNRNYVYDFTGVDGTRVAEIEKAELYAVLQTSSGEGEITKTYGTLPMKNELKIYYTGFRGEDYYEYGSDDTTVIQTPATIPNFVDNLAENGTDRIAVLYSVGEHNVAPDASTFDAKNYTLVTDPSITENAFVFKVEKKTLTVKSAPVGEGEVLRKFFGTLLLRGVDYSVSFGDGMGGDFVTSVMLPDGSSAAVADSADSVFFNAAPDAEWVSYDPSVNIVRNVATATEIAPNTDLMNVVSKNYDVSAVVGDSLKLEIFNRLQSIEVANQTSGSYYAYVAKAANGQTNRVRVKLVYLDGECVYIDLPLDTDGGSFETEKHILNFSVSGYHADATENQSLTLNVTEENALIAEENTGNNDERQLEITVRNVPTADKTVSSEYLGMTFVGTALDARENAIERTVTYTNNAPSSASRFNLAEVSFLLMRTANGGSFDVQFYNAKTKDAATHRYTVRVATDTRTSGYQTISVYEQQKNGGNGFDGIETVSPSATYSIGSIDLFDETSHGCRFFLNKLTNTLQIEIDGVVFVTHRISGGTLQGISGDSAIGIAINRAYGYVTKIALTEEGYSSEDAVRIVAESEREKTIPLGLEQYARINPKDYFAYLWNYAGDFYYDGMKAPEIKYYVDGAETGLTEGWISLSQGSYRITVKAFRGSMELSSATVILNVVDGYYIDKFVHLDGDEVVDETMSPSVNTPVTLSGGSGGKVYQGVENGADYSHYRLDFTGVDLSNSASGAYTRTLDFNIKSSDPSVTAFNAANADVNYIGLTLRILRTDDTFTTSLKLIAGDGTDTVRPAAISTNSVDWKKTGGIYSVKAVFDQKNLYVRVEIFFNGQSLYVFNLDGRIEGQELEQDAETATGRADVNNLDVMKTKAPISWAAAMLSRLRAGHSVVLDSDTSVTVSRVELNTNSDETTDYIATTSATANNITTLTSRFRPNLPDGNHDSVNATGTEISYMIGENGFAVPSSGHVRAGVYDYNTYGVKFKATPFSGMTNKLRFILAENAPKTDADDQNRYSAKSMRNVSLTFIRRGGETRLFFSFNDSVYNTGLTLDEVGEARNFRYEQELYSFANAAGDGQIDLFDGQEHTVIVTFDKKDNNVEVSSGLVNTQTLGNYVKVYVDGTQVGGTYLFPAYNNVSPWYYTDENGERKALAAQTTAPFYDRYFLDEKTSAGLSFRGIEIDIMKLAVSAKEDHLNFLK